MNHLETTPSVNLTTGLEVVYRSEYNLLRGTILKVNKTTCAIKCHHGNILVPKVRIAGLQEPIVMIAKETKGGYQYRIERILYKPLHIPAGMYPYQQTVCEPTGGLIITQKMIDHYGIQAAIVKNANRAKKLQELGDLLSTL